MSILLYFKHKTHIDLRGLSMTEVAAALIGDGERSLIYRRPDASHTEERT